MDENIGIVLRDFSTPSARAIGFSDDPELIRRVAQNMAEEYRLRAAELPEGPNRQMELGRVRVLENIANPNAEGASGAKPWWEAMTESLPDEEVPSPH